MGVIGLTGSLGLKGKNSKVNPIMLLFTEMTSIRHSRREFALNPTA